MATNFGQRRIYYNNFAEHLLNAYNPNMLYPGLPHAWSDDGWRRVIDMVAGFGFNVFEFWLVPRFFCREGLSSDYGRAFIRQMNAIIEHAHTRGVAVELLCGLATSGNAWRTLCPNLPDEWAEIEYLWEQWARALPEVDIYGIFPGDPGACSRNGCTALTYIDRSADVAQVIKRANPRAEIELGTWGTPFWGWGVIQGPPGWQGEFIQEYQHTAWAFDLLRAEESMAHLLKRLPDFPSPTSVALNMGFNSDGNPVGEQDARRWVREIAQSYPVQSWDFSLTEGENAIVPHYRFERLFARRKLERDCGGYRGGICFTMTPLLNQLSLYESAHSFIDPDADHGALAREFYVRLFGPGGAAIVAYLPLFEVVQDWGNYQRIELPRAAYHAKMKELEELLRSLAGCEREELALFPAAPAYREELAWFAGLFAELSGPAPDYEALARRYWQRVFTIWDRLPAHVDPRARGATAQLIQRFAAMG